MILESPVSRQELISYLQKHVDWKINKNQRHGINLWVLITSIGLILFQLFTKYFSMENINNDSSTFFFATINLILVLWTLMMFLQGTSQFSLLIHGENEIKKTFFLLFIQCIVLFIVIMGNLNSAFICYENVKNLDLTKLIYDTGTGYYYFSPNVVNVSGLLLFIIFSCWYAIIFYQLKKYIINIMATRPKPGIFNKPAFVMYEPPNFLVNSLKKYLPTIILILTTIIAIHDFVFRILLIKSDPIISSSLLIGLLILMIIFIEQLIDKINEKILLRESGQLFFSYAEDYELRYRIKQVLQIETVIDWVAYIHNLLEFNKKLLKDISYKNELYSQHYLMLNKINRKNDLLNECYDLKEKIIKIKSWLEEQASETDILVLIAVDAFIEDFSQALEKAEKTK